MASQENKPTPLPPESSEQLGSGLSERNLNVGDLFSNPSPELAARLAHEEKRAAMWAARFKASYEADKQAIENRPTTNQHRHVFLYGSLMDPEVLQIALNLPDLPVLRKGWIEGFKIKMYGRIPGLVNHKGGIVSGVFWQLTSVGQMLDILHHDADFYAADGCVIHDESGQLFSNSTTFTWNRHLDKGELMDGAFDMDWYSKNTKPMLVDKARIRNNPSSDSVENDPWAPRFITTKDRHSQMWKPTQLFFYGSLKDPEVLQRIAGLPDLPTLQNGTITGFKMKMWNIYPTLIPCENGKISGKYFLLWNVEHFYKIERYETKAYAANYCDIANEDGYVLKDCLTFVWSGEPDSKDLKDGIFDLENFQKDVKPRLLR